MEKLANFLAVGLGGAIGSMMRYGITLMCAALSWSGNIGTMMVNVIGSFAIGFLSGSVKEGTLLLLLTVGLCGGFTTFSTFSLQSVRLFQDGKIGALVLYVLGSVILCILAAALGYFLAGRKLL
ncbi:MAG: fluoride efflux transporter CrcB [Bacteroidales bacterium]|nr:fluoride efflux transporter CrcB [Bacteroidales bacterium]